MASLLYSSSFATGTPSAVASFRSVSTLRKVIAGLALQTEIVPQGKLSNGWRLPFDATA
jgi:hypothetical protein